MRGKTELSASLALLLQKGHEKTRDLFTPVHPNSFIPQCLFASGLYTKAKPHGRHDWHFLILEDTKKHVITMNIQHLLRYELKCQNNKGIKTVNKTPKIGSVNF